MDDIEQKQETVPSGHKAENEEISLIDLFAVLWQRKKLIITIVVVAMIGVVGFSVLTLYLPPDINPLPNEYTPAAIMLINNASSQGGGLSSMISSSGLGGLASLAGLSLPSGSTYSDLAIYLTGSNTLLDTLVDKFDLIARYKIKKYPRAESRRALKKKLSAAYDEKSGVFSVAFTDYDPAFARELVNYCVGFLGARFDELGLDKNRLEKENLEINIENTYREIQNLELESRRLEQSVNRGAAAGLPSISLELNRISLELDAQRQVYTQLKVQYELLKVSIASEKPTFQILELAEAPDKKSGPSRGLICVIVTFAAGFFAVFLAFAFNAVSNIRADPEAMAKLRGEGPR
jgi:uncharacterized protein involved in exopolysaccharide biosynthesis